MIYIICAFIIGISIIIGLSKIANAILKIRTIKIETDTLYVAHENIEGKIIRNQIRNNKL